MTRRLLVTAALLGILLTTSAPADETKDVKVGGITLKTPASWKFTPPRNRLRLGQFSIPAAEGDKEPAELAIFAFGAQNAASNVNRWVNQFQPAGRKSKTTRGKSQLGEYVFVDITGTYNKPVGPPIAGRTKPTPGSRVLAVMLSVKGKETYFLKMAGEEKTVSAAAKSLRASFGGDAETEKPFED